MTQIKTKPQKRVHVDVSRYDLEGKISDIVSFLQKLRTKHGGADIQIDLSAEDYYGAYSVEVCAWYYRDETPEETVAREKEAAKMKARQETRDREQFEALKKKFGDA